MENRELKTPVFGSITALQADTTALEFNGERFLPDQTKAYARFAICHGFPCITAYGTNFHPGTIANSFQSLKHQVVDYDHRMRVHDKSKDKTEIPHDQVLGFVASVDYPDPPAGGWKLGLDRSQAPAIEGIMGLFKNAQKAPQVLGEYLSGRHKWTTSIEAKYDFINCGFVVGDAAKGDRKQRALMDDDTPPDLGQLGFGYVTVESAPDELLNCFDLNKGRIVGAWNKLPVSLMMGGINQHVHLAGVGVVRYGAEREAEIQTILASDPDRLQEMSEDDLGLAYFRGTVESLEQVAALLSPASN